MNADTDPQARGAMMQLLSGYWYTQTLYVVAKLGIADLLDDGPRSSAALAEACDADPGALRRLLRALSAVGVFEQTAPDTFGLTPLSACLRSQASGSLRAAALLGGVPSHWQAWGALLKGVRAGTTAFELAHDAGFFEYMDDHIETQTIFQAVMTGPAAWNDAIVAAYDFSHARKLIDVGGGQGSLVLAVLAAHLEARAVVLDRPHVIDSVDAQQRCAHARCDWQAGDFFERVPGPVDHCLLRLILHDWPDDDAVTILRNCRASLVPNGRILVIENLLAGDEVNGTDLLDVSMMVLTGGRERSKDEYSRLLDRSGLKLTAVLPTNAGLSVLVAEATVDR